jgi:hypothetical protein
MKASTSDSVSSVTPNKRLPALVIAAFSLAACSPCVELNLGASPSPDGRFVAEVVERNCGAPQGVEQHLRLAKPLFRRWPFGRTDTLVIGGPHAVRTQWSANSRELDVWYGGGNVLKRSERWGDVEIRYHDVMVGQDHVVEPPPGELKVVTTQQEGVRSPGPGRRVIGHRPRKRND